MGPKKPPAQRNLRKASRGAEEPKLLRPDLGGLCGVAPGDRGGGWERRPERTGYVKLRIKPSGPGPLLSARVAAFQAGPGCQPHPGLCWNPSQWPSQPPGGGPPSLPTVLAGSGEASLSAPGSGQGREEGDGHQGLGEARAPHP